MTDSDVAGLSRHRLRLSVVIPAYNASAYLGEALMSVRRQTIAPDEVIVVDDESTDDTFRLAQSLGVLALRTGRTGGPARARNTGIRACTGDIVAFLDADDTWEPLHCEELLKLLQAFPEAGVVFGHVASFGGRVEYQPRSLPEATPVSLWPDITRRNYLPQSGTAVRRELLLRVGGYDEDEALRFSEDYDLWMRLAPLTVVACTHKMTCNYRVHDQQASQSAWKLVKAQTNARAKLLARLAAGNSADVPVVSTKIHEAWAALLHGAWVQGDRKAWEAALEVAHAVPDSDALARSWRLRRLIWPAWHVRTRTKALLKKALSQFRKTQARLASLSA